MEEAPADKTKVRIYTDQFIIVGELGMYAGTRMTDYIISAHEFIAVTNARILSIEGKGLFNAGFLNVQKSKIVLIVPDSEIKPA